MTATYSMAEELRESLRSSLEELQDHPFVSRPDVQRVYDAARNWLKVLDEREHVSVTWCEIHQAPKYRIFAWCEKARPIGNTLSGERCRFIERLCKHGKLKQHEIVLFTDYQGNPHCDPFVVCPGPMEENEARRETTTTEIRVAVETVRRTGTINDLAPALVAVTDAALILADLVDNSEVIEWCESHSARALRSWYLNRCPVGTETRENGCRMVPKLLVDRKGVMK